MASDFRHDDVERRAYELYERRGGEHGHDWDDWLQAEREILGADAASDSTETGSTPSRRRVDRGREIAAQV